MNLQLIAPDGIETYWNANRAFNKKHMHAIARHMDANGFDKAHPLRVVQFSDESLHLAAGHHRHTAATLLDTTYENLPLTKVWAEIVAGDMDTLIRIMEEDNIREHSPGANRHRGLPLSRDRETQSIVTMMMFKDVFLQSNRELGVRFGRSHANIGDLRKEVSGKIFQIESALKSAKTEEEKSAVLLEFRITETRLYEMLSVIRSGEREVKRGDQVYKQKTVAGTDRQEAERAALIETCLQHIADIRFEINALVEEYPTLEASKVKRRLYKAFTLNFSDNPKKWTPQGLRSETRMRESLLELLRDRDNPLVQNDWITEFQLTDSVNEYRNRFRDMEGPLRDKDAQLLFVDCSKVDTEAWENLSQSARLQNLKEWLHWLPHRMQAEQTQRKEEAERVAASNRRKKLIGAVRTAEAACKRLKTVFHASRIEDKTPAGWHEFLTTACHIGGYSREPIQAKSFKFPHTLKDANDTGQLAYKVAGIADKIAVDLGSADPPAWITALFAEPTPAPPPSPAQAKAGMEAKAKATLASMQAESVLEPDADADADASVKEAQPSTSAAGATDTSDALPTPDNLPETHHQAVEHVVRLMETEVFPKGLPDVPIPSDWIIPFRPAALAAYPEMSLIFNPHPDAQITATEARASEKGWRKVAEDLQNGAAWVSSYLAKRKANHEACVEMNARWNAVQQKGVSARWENGKWFMAIAGESTPFYAEYGGKDIQVNHSYVMVTAAEEHLAAKETESKTEVEPPAAQPANASVLDADTLRKIRDAVNAIGAVLPLTSRVMPSTVASLDEQIRKQCPDTVESVHLLRSLLTRALARMKT